MQFVEMDPMTLDQDTLQDLKKICFWVDDQPNTILYALKDQVEIYSVAVVKDLGTAISTTKQVDFGTKKEFQRKGYATKCFELVLEDLKTKKEVKEVYVQALNPVTAKIASHFLKDSDGMGTWFFQNPNFEQVYDTMCDGIQEGILQEQDKESFCKNDPYKEAVYERFLLTHQRREDALKKETMHIENHTLK